MVIQYIYQNKSNVSTTIQFLYLCVFLILVKIHRRINGISCWVSDLYRRPLWVARNHVPPSYLWPSYRWRHKLIVYQLSNVQSLWTLPCNSHLLGLPLVSSIMKARVRDNSISVSVCSTTIYLLFVDIMYKTGSN